MYLELKDIKKSFGTGENRTQVLKGISCGIEKGKISKDTPTPSMVIFKIVTLDKNQNLHY